MREKAVLLGRTKSLFGIITPPTVELLEVAQQRPAIILLNSGLLHRVGPNRFYVKLARHLSKKGFLVLRFDLSGIGDSPVPADNSAYDAENGVVQDTQAVMDFLAQGYGNKSFILMGLCSGADNGFKVACQDARVVGVNLIEGFSFPTTQYFVRAYSKSWLSLESWKRLFTGRSEIWSILKGLFIHYTSRRTRQLTENLQVPLKEQLLRDLQTLTERNVRLCFLYSSKGAGEYNYDKLIKDNILAMPADCRPRVELVPDSDHLFTLLAHQQLLLDMTTDWLETVAARSPKDSVLNSD